MHLSVANVKYTLVISLLVHTRISTKQKLASQLGLYFEIRLARSLVCVWWDLWLFLSVATAYITFGRWWKKFRGKTVYSNMAAPIVKIITCLVLCCAIYGSAFVVQKNIGKGTLEEMVVNSFEPSCLSRIGTKGQRWMPRTNVQLIDDHENLLAKLSEQLR